LLEELRLAVGDLGARADKLGEDYRMRSARDRVRRQAQLDEHAAGMSAGLANEERLYEEAKARALEKFEQRKLRISRAYQSSKEKGLRDIENKSGGRKYELQKAMLHAEREREKELAQAAAARQEFQTALAAEQQALAQREIAARMAYKGYGSMSQAFSSAYQNPRPEVSADETHLLDNLRGLLQTADAGLRRLHRNVFFRLFRYVPLWLVLMGATVGLVPVLQAAGQPWLDYEHAAMAAGAAFVVILVIRLWLAHQSQAGERKHQQSFK
jgi:hypothetical protein